MPTIYLETSIPSYLAARSSRDQVIAAHQKITRQRWKDARERFDMFVSEAVMNEILIGDPDAVPRRLSLIRDLPVLPMIEDVGFLLDE